MGGNGHVEFLRPSNPDLIALADAVATRFVELCGAWERVRGVRLQVPVSLLSDVNKCRRVRQRHKMGDFRHLPSEWKALKTVAQWLVDMNCELRGQKKIKVQWSDE